MFEELLAKRQLHHLSGGMSDEMRDQGSQALLNLKPDKKWALVYNDLLAEWNQTRERFKSRSRAVDHGFRVTIARNSPQWYIQRIMEGNISVSDMASLSVALRTSAIGWVEDFVQLKGNAVLGTFLYHLRSQRLRTQDDLALEDEVIKVFRALFNSTPGANDALDSLQSITEIVACLQSAQMSTRRQAGDILVFLCYYIKSAGHTVVLRAFDDLNEGNGRFNQWLQRLETTIDGRGIMGSKVGASREVKRAKGSNESLDQYAASSILLITALLDSRIVSDLNVRTQLRSELEAAGARRAIDKLRALNLTLVQPQIQAYDSLAQADADELAQNSHSATLADLKSPQNVFTAVLTRLQGSQAQDYFLKGLKHLLSLPSDPLELVHYHQLIESLTAAVVFDGQGGNDMSSLLGMGMNRVLSRFADSDQMNATQAELQQMKRKLADTEEARDQAEAQLLKGSASVIESLRTEKDQLHADLDMARDNAQVLEQEMQTLDRWHTARYAQLEAQMRERYAMALQGQTGSISRSLPAQISGSVESDWDVR